MIYTIGTTENYERGIDEQAAKGQPLMKVGKHSEHGAAYPGGSCWKTKEDAEQYIREHGIGDTFSVYGLDADWERDTEPAGEEGASWRSLLRDAPVVSLTRQIGLADAMRKPVKRLTDEGAVWHGKVKIEHESGMTHYQVAMVPLERLKTADWNPRVVFTEDFRKLKESILADPVMLTLRPILAMEDGTIYAGTMRYEAVKALYAEGHVLPFGDGAIPAVLADVDEKTAQARAIRDNHHAGNDQEEALAAILMSLDDKDQAGEELGSTVRSLGIRDEEILNILATVGAATPVNPFTGERVEPETWAEPSAQEDVQLPDRADLRLVETSGDPEVADGWDAPENDAQERSGSTYVLTVLLDDCHARDALALELFGREFPVTASRLEYRAGQREAVSVDEDDHLGNVLREHGYRQS